MQATQGAVRRLAQCVRDVPATPGDVANSPNTILENATEEVSTLRVWTDRGEWWTTSFAGQIAQWQCTVVVEEQTQGGTSIRTAQLRPRGVALPLSGAARYKVSVVLAWIGAGAPPLPSLADVNVYVSVSPGAPRYHELPAGRIVGTADLLTLVPDLPGESGTQNGVRFTTGVRLAWTYNGGGGGPTYNLDGVNIAFPIGWGNIVVNPERLLVLSNLGGSLDSSVSAFWEVYE